MTDHRRATVLTGGGAGAVDKIDGAGLSADDTIQCINSTGIYNYVNIQDSAAENSPYVIRPDTNPGTNSWHLVIPNGPYSHVLANHTTGQSIPDSTSTIVVFDVEEYDLLSEYNNSTGIFVPKYTGIYSITSNILYDNATFTASQKIVIEVFVNSIFNKELGREIGSGAINYMSVNGAINIKLIAGVDFDLRTFQLSGGSKSLYNATGQSFLSIDRIA